MKTVLDFGADPTGANDSTSAFQAAVDSSDAIGPAPGLFKIAGTVVFNKPKRFTMVKPLLEPFAVDYWRRPARAPGPNVPMSHTRLWTDCDNIMFDIRSSQVFIEGGAFDTQPASGRTQPIVRYIDPLDHNARANGWGGAMTDFLMLGNYLEIGNVIGGGCDGILVDLASTTVNNAYWTHVLWRGRVAGLRCGWRSTPRNNSLGHWANTSEIDLDVSHSKQAVVNESFSGLHVRVRHQGSYCFASEAEMESSPSVFSRGDVEVIDQKFFDFGKPAAYVDQANTRLWWFNKHTLELHGQQNVIDDTDSNTFDKAKYIGGTKPRYRLDGARGFLPRLSTGQTSSGVFIPELHDALYQQLAANITQHTVKAYEGNANLPDQPQSTVATESTAITILRPDTLFKYIGTFTEFAWSPEAMARDDYVELVLKCTRSLNDLLLTFAGSPKAVQVILNHTSSGVTIDNQTMHLHPRDAVPTPIRFRVPIQTFDQMIIRFIGNYGGNGGKIIPHSITGMDTRHKWATPFMLDF